MGNNLKSILIAGVAVFLILWVIVLVKINSQPAQTDEGTPVTQAQTVPPVQYKDEQSKKMMTILEERPALTASDQAIRQKLASLPSPLSETKEYSMEYLSAPDEFMVEIRTIDINRAKESAVAWLKGKGLSDVGICHLPLVFYLNGEVANNLKDMNMQFDPLPPGC